MSCAKTDGSGVSHAMQPELAAMDALQHGAQAVEVHGLLQAVADRLVHERMVGNCTIAGNVLETGRGIGKHRRHQIVGQHALKLRRHACGRRALRGTASEIVEFQRQRVLNTGASRNACTSTSRVVSGWR